MAVASTTSPMKAVWMIRNFRLFTIYNLRFTTLVSADHNLFHAKAQRRKGFSCWQLIIIIHGSRL